MFKKINRFALLITVTVPLLVLAHANAEQASVMPELAPINLDSAATTETTAFDLSHSSISPNALLMPLNINTATQIELTALPGIGEYKAAQIIQWRESHGEFMTKADLVNVKGIGKGTVTKLADKIAVTDL